MIQDYFNTQIKTYEQVKTGSAIQPVITWQLNNTFYGNVQVKSGNQAIINAGSTIIADLILFCDIKNIMGYENRIVIDENVYKVVFIEKPYRQNHAEILLKLMPKNTYEEMGI